MVTLPTGVKNELDKYVLGPALLLAVDIALQVQDQEQLLLRLRREASANPEQDHLLATIIRALHLNVGSTSLAVFHPF